MPKKCEIDPALFQQVLLVNKAELLASDGKTLVPRNSQIYVRISALLEEKLKPTSIFMHIKMNRNGIGDLLRREMAKESLGESKSLPKVASEAAERELEIPDNVWSKLKPVKKLVDDRHKVTSRMVSCSKNVPIIQWGSFHYINF